MAKALKQIEYEWLDVFKVDFREALAKVRTLSKKEKAVVELRMMGKPKRTIAVLLGIRQVYVNYFWHRALKKLGLSKNPNMMGRLWWAAMTFGVEWERKYAEKPPPSPPRRNFHSIPRDEEGNYIGEPYEYAPVRSKRKPYKKSMRDKRSKVVDVSEGKE